MPRSLNEACRGLVGTEVLRQAPRALSLAQGQAPTETGTAKAKILDPRWVVSYLGTWVGSNSAPTAVVQSGDQGPPPPNTSMPASLQKRMHVCMSLWAQRCASNARPSLCAPMRTNQATDGCRAMFGPLVAIQSCSSESWQLFQTEVSN